MGILDYLHPSDRDDLLELLRNAAASGDNPSGTPPRSADLPSPLDTEPWPAGPVGAPTLADALRRPPAPFSFVPAPSLFAPNQPSQLDTARWPVGPVGVPSSKIVRQNQSSPLDTARWPVGPVGAPSTRIEELNESSPLDSAQWPVGPVGAPPHTDALMMSPAPFGFVPAQLSGGFSRGMPARSVLAARPLASVSPGLGAEIDRAPAHDTAAGPADAAARRNPSVLSPLPFGFVPAPLSGGVFNSTPAATQAPRQTPAASQARAGADAGQSALESDPWLAAANGWLDGIPVVGPYLISHGDRSMARARAERYGTSYDDELRSIQALTKRTAEDHPFATGASKWAGTFASLAPLGMTAAGAEALGLAGGPLIQMGARGALTSGLIGGADAAARNRGVLAGAGLAALGGAFGPVVGRVAGANAESLGMRAMQSPALANIAARIRLQSALQNGTVRKSAAKLAGGLGLRRGLSDEQSLAPKQDDDQD